MSKIRQVQISCLHRYKLFGKSLDVGLLKQAYQRSHKVFKCRLTKFTMPVIKLQSAWECYFFNICT